MQKMFTVFFRQPPILTDCRSASLSKIAQDWEPQNAENQGKQ